LVFFFFKKLENGEVQRVEHPIRITVTRTEAPAVLYPLYYLQTTNNQPYEQITGLLFRFFLLVL
jgi:hypothetical protein